MIEICIHGRGGQGAVVASQILSYALFLEGKFSQSFPTFGAERRGAPVAAYVRISNTFINNRYEVTNPNYVIVLSGKLTEKIDVSSGIKDNGLILINSEKDSSYFSFIKEKCRVLAFDVNSISLRYKLGSAYMPMVNVPILGVFARITDLLQLDSLIKALPRFITVSLKKNEDALIESYNQASLICA